MTLREYLDSVRNYRPSAYIHYTGAPLFFVGATTIPKQQEAIENLCNGKLEVALEMYLEECKRFLEFKGTSWSGYWIRPGIILNIKLILRGQYDISALEYLYYLRDHLTPWCSDKLGLFVMECNKIFNRLREQLGKPVILAIAECNLDHFSSQQLSGGDSIRGEISSTMRAASEDVRKSHALYSYHGLSLFGAKLPEQLGAENAIELFKHIAREAENKLRQSWGIPNVGEGWISETELYVTIREQFRDRYRVIHHGRPKWLGRQHFDIWIPDISVAIEYNGLQHREPVKHFGGTQGFEDTMKRDEKKRNLASDNGVLLIEADQDTDLATILDEIHACISKKED